MPNITPLSEETHSNKYWIRFTSFQFTSSTHQAPVVAAELASAIKSLALAFTRQGNIYTLTCLLSPIAGQNLFIDAAGRWLGGYVPSFFRGHPFCLARIPGTDKMRLCVDEASGLISETDGELFFDDKGQLSKAVTDVKDFLTKVEQNRTATDQAVSALADAGLIIPWPVKVKIDNIEVSIPDLYRVDDGKLHSLSDEAFLHLRKTQALPLAYAQLFSMPNMGLFAKLAQIRKQLDVKTGARQIQAAVQFDDDMIRFS
ncbi:SapC family protein [Desulfonatronum thioautotrophicum]|uniref:SapC family protein n=1 Tax=Desulfonatronum thioautotrophicum TaxID=617001 RepID=UPI00069B8C9F|nr:SapC family protein [Desulfonatronum thioautotrophicum]